MNSKWSRDRELSKASKIFYLKMLNKETFTEPIFTRKEFWVDLMRLKELQYQLVVTLYQEESLWFQKSRSQWITYGDQNIKYYHSKTILGGDGGKSVLCMMRWNGVA